MWFWIHPNPTAQPRTIDVTLFEPTDTPLGNYAIRASHRTGDGNRTAIASAVTIEEPRPPKRVLAGEDHKFQFDEVLRAIELFNAGDPVTGTGGTMLSFEHMLRAIESFNTNSSVSAYKRPVGDRSDASVARYASQNDLPYSQYVKAGQTILEGCQRTISENSLPAGDVGPSPMILREHDSVIRSRIECSGSTWQTRPLASGQCRTCFQLEPIGIPLHSVSLEHRFSCCENPPDLNAFGFADWSSQGNYNWIVSIGGSHRKPLANCQTGRDTADTIRPRPGDDQMECIELLEPNFHEV